MPATTTRTAAPKPEPATERKPVGTPELADAIAQGLETKQNKRSKGEDSRSVLADKKVVGEILVRPRTGVWAQTKVRPKGVTPALAKRLEVRKGGWACGVLVKSDKDVAAARQLLGLAVRGGAVGGNASFPPQ